MATVDLETLRNLPFMEGAELDLLARLAESAVEQCFYPGQIILEEGSTGRELYLVVGGLVEVVKGRGADGTVLARRGPGEFFGEMGLVEVKPRFATVRALHETRVLEFSEQKLRSVLAQQPALLYHAVRVLSGRLREADQQMIADLQHKNQELAHAYRQLQEAQAALVEKKRLEQELDFARELQQSILPQTFPDAPGFGLAARSQPAWRVGGDFYDVIPLSKGRIGLVMADVSDKGMPAALYMALAHSLIHAEARHRSSPRQVLLTTHRLLLEMSQADMFVTVFYGVLEPALGKMRYTRAGHDYPLLLRPTTGECRFLTSDGAALGFVEKVGLQEDSVDLLPGDVLVLYTDGITDANSPAGEFFGVERLCDAVRSSTELSADAVCDGIFERVQGFQAGSAQYDDMALLVVKADATSEVPGTL